MYLKCFIEDHFPIAYLEKKSMPAISSLLQSIYPLSEPALEELLQGLIHQEFPKQYYLLKQGRVCRHLWFLTRGAVRYFYTHDDGKEANVWFSFEGDIVSEPMSFTRQCAALESIQLMEDAEVYALPFDHLQTLLRERHEVCLWYIKLIEQHYMPNIEDRVGDLQFLNAAQRYHKLLEQFPDITNRIPLGHIASFLNITQETLSRIRAGKV
jgi:CRP/FNR family transcriptional regulator, anaerobic regulatory protein